MEQLEGWPSRLVSCLLCFCLMLLCSAIVSSALPEKARGEGNSAQIVIRQGTNDPRFFPDTALLREHFERRGKIYSEDAIGCDVSYEIDVRAGSHLVDAGFNPAPWSQDGMISCYYFTFYPDSGEILFMVDSISHCETDSCCTAVSASIKASSWDDTVWVRATNGGIRSSVTVRTDAVTDEEWLARVTYLAYLDCTQDHAHWYLQHDPLDLDLRVRPYDPYVDTSYSHPYSPPSAPFVVENVGDDEVPAEFEFRWNLYCSPTVECPHAAGEQVEAYGVETFLSGQQVSVFAPQVCLQGVGGSEWPVVVRVDPDNIYGSSDPYKTNNCSEVARVFWHYLLRCRLHYFDWENWLGPGAGQYIEVGPEDVLAELFIGQSFVDSALTDAFGECLLFYSQRDSGVLGQLWFTPNVDSDFEARDSTNTWEVATGQQLLMLPGQDVVVNFFDDDWPDPAADRLMNAAVNFRLAQRSYRDFLLGNGLSTASLIPVDLRLEDGPWYQLGAGFHDSCSCIRSPSFISESRYFNRFSVHELSHQMHWYYVDSVPGYAQVLENPYTSHVNNVTAVVEGWAIFCQAIVPTLDVYAAAYTHDATEDSLYLSSTIESNVWSLIYLGGRDGEWSPGAVGTLLYDLHDAGMDTTWRTLLSGDTLGYPNQQGGTPYFEVDSLEETYSWIFTHFMNGEVRNSYDFVEAFEDAGSNWCRQLYIQNFSLNYLHVGGCWYTDVDEPDSAANTLPVSFSVGDAFPNPFNGVISVDLSLPQESDVSLVVYNILGQQVFRRILEGVPAGEGRVSLDFGAIGGGELASGIYLLELSANGDAITKKLQLLK